MKRVLLAVCGLSPQVITETVFALMQQGRMVDSIFVLTTRIGKEKCDLSLLHPEHGQFLKMLREYGLNSENVDFSHRNVIAVRNADGTDIQDIIEEEDSEAFLGLCMETTFSLTRDEDTAVYFSIAGGRKTMGACLAIAAQFYARQQDRIFHVLVSPEFESSRDFFYPPAQTRPIELLDTKGQPYSKESKYARLNLVPMPFFSIRDRLANGMLKRPESPASLMLSLVREKRNELIVYLNLRRIAWKGHEADLPPAHMALYTLFCLRKKRRTCAESCQSCEDCTLSYQDVDQEQLELARLYQQASADRTLEVMSETGIMAINQENFNSYKAKINRRLEQAFGAYDSEKLKIASLGTRPGVRYGLRLKKKDIRIVM